MLAKKGLQRAARPVPEREVSSHPPLLPAAAGGKREHWKALKVVCRLIEGNAQIMVLLGEI